MALLRLRRYLASFRLRFDGDMEAQFQEKHQEFVLRSCPFWIVLYILIIVAAVLVKLVRNKWFQNPGLALYAHAIPFAIFGLLGAVVKFTRILRPYTERLVCGACLLMVVWNAWSVHLLVETDLERSHSTTLPTVWAALKGNGAAESELQEYIIREVSRKMLWYVLSMNFLLVDFLQFMGISYGAMLVFVSLPISFVVAAFASPLISKDMAETTIGAAVLTIYTTCLAYQMSKVVRQQFHSDYQLRQALSNKAELMQEAAQRELSQKVAQQQADTVLNHILKNVMADAAGCIYLFLSSWTETVPPDLVNANNCLDRGMAWCRKRQALLRISSGKYTPTLAPFSLRQLGTSLTRGRNVTLRLLEETVLLDATLCDIVLDNALNNAFRHGHPDDPDVKFSMSLGPPATHPVDSNWRELTFKITNRPHPNRPLVTREFVNRVLSGMHDEPSSPLSENLGLTHLYMAAQTHGMTLSLQQEGPLVVLRVEFDVEPRSSNATPGDSNALTAPPLPPGLLILCLDDSAVARRVLERTLQQHVMMASVETFGDRAEEVPAFIQAALSGADMVLLDNHLDFDGHVHLLGTDVLKSLRAQGYTGFACIRSANVSASDQLEYKASGAQCVIGKDIHPLQMIAQLQVAFKQFQQEGQWQAMSLNTQLGIPPPHCLLLHCCVL